MPANGSYRQPAGSSVAPARLYAVDFRHPYDLPATIGSVVVALALMVPLGNMYGYLQAMAVPVLMAVIAVVFTIFAQRGSSVQVTPEQFPRIWEIAESIAHKLDMPVPPIFVIQSPILNAYATGVAQFENVTLHSALIEHMTERELAAVIAHEFGHLKCNHIIYLVVRNLSSMGPVSAFVAIPFRWLFFFSSRLCEYSADRAALIGTHDLQACITSQVKLSVGSELFKQMNFDAYLQQIDEFNASKAGHLSEFLLNKTHPETINRIQALIRFYRDNSYQRCAADHGRAGTTILTSGAAGTRALFKRVAKKVERERASGESTLSPASDSVRVSRAGETLASGAETFTESDQINCTQCDTNLPVGARFCIHCGSAVNRAESVSSLGSSSPTLQFSSAPVAEQAQRAGVAQPKTRKVVRKRVTQSMPDSDATNEFVS